MSPTISHAGRPIALWALSALSACVLLSACGPQPGGTASSGGITRLSIATGGTGGVYYPYGGGIAKIISENLAGVEATAEATAASVDNLKFLRDGRSDIAFSMADTVDDAALGQGSFKEFGSVPSRALAVLVHQLPPSRDAHQHRHHEHRRPEGHGSSRPGHPAAAPKSWPFACSKRSGSIRRATSRRRRSARRNPWMR